MKKDHPLVVDEAAADKQQLPADKKRLSAFVFLLALSVVAGYGSLIETARLAFNQDAFTYIPLVLMLCAAFMYLRWRSVRKLATYSVAAGVPLLVIAAGIALGGYFWSSSLPDDALLSVRMAALVVWWAGAFALCFGWRASRVALFPLVFLFAVVPLPATVLDWIVSQLQIGSAWSAMALFHIFGVPVLRDGVYLNLPGLTLQVATECSSIRSSSMLLITAIGVAQMLLRSPWRKAIVILVAVPLSVAKNGLRIFTIAMLSIYVDPGYLTGKFHHQGGIVFFAVALALLLVLVWWLRKAENKPKAKVEGDTTGATVPGPIEASEDPTGARR
jgi:exosortase